MLRVAVMVLVPLLMGVGDALVVHALPWRVPCPPQCLCQIKPWYSPQSLYREAPTVDCNNLLLTALPPSLPLDTHTLRLQGNLIGSLDQRDLEGVANLTELDISQNRLMSTRQVRIANLPSLLSLHLEENQLRHLPDAAFAGLPGLQELYLNHNHLRSAAPGAFTGLHNLLRLHLNSNQLLLLDRRWFQHLPRLEVLMVGGNPITSLQDFNFKPLESLRSLVLAGMGLRELSSRSLEGLEQLESISFYDNLLTQVPKVALQKLPQLKFLDLNKNPIQVVEKGDLQGMLHLRELGLNNMDELVSVEQSALVNLPQLTKLEMTNNPRLSYIHPQAFQQLPSMESMMLNNNALTALHQQVALSLPSLQELSLHSNPIRCDCLMRWMGKHGHGHTPVVRFIEPQSTLCSEPPELKSRRVRDVSFREMAESCLPLIATGTLPAVVRAGPGDKLELHCRALAEPDPTIFWVTPRGMRLSPPSQRGRYQVRAEGTLVIKGVATDDEGLYTCVAQNLVGADTRIVTLHVEGGEARRVNPTRHQKEALEVRVVGERYALLAWRGHNVPSAHLSWLANGSHDDAPRHTHRILAGTRGVNLTRLRPGTHYKVCLHTGPKQISCVDLKTKPPSPTALNQPPDLTPAVLLAVSALLLLLAARTCQGGASMGWRDEELTKSQHTLLPSEESKALEIVPVFYPPPPPPPPPVSEPCCPEERFLSGEVRKIKSVEPLQGTDDQAIPQDILPSPPKVQSLPPQVQAIPLNVQFTPLNIQAPSSNVQAPPPNIKTPSGVIQAPPLLKC